MRMNPARQTSPIPRSEQIRAIRSLDSGLIDPFQLGRYAIELRDPADDRLLVERGFDSYFGEYRTTEAARAEMTSTAGRRGIGTSIELW